MGKQILITGAAGFIGFHLAQYLNERGDSVIGLDNFNDYYEPQLKRDRVAQLQGKKIPVIRGDVCDRDTLIRLVEEHKISHIVHLAAQAGVRYSLENPDAYLRSNLDGFLQILETCRQFPHLKLTYASSSSIYGLNTKVPFSTDDRTDQQASLYGVTKKANELMAQTYHHLYHIPVTGLRFFTVYGPWGRPDMAYYHFADKILKGEPIEVFNQGDMKRDFTYIDDIVKGIAAAIDLEAECEVFNLGNSQPETLLSFIETLEEALGVKAEKIYKPMQPGDVPSTYADISKSEDLLGFKPATPLSKGIPQFVNWYQSYRENRLQSEIH